LSQKNSISIDFIKKRSIHNSSGITHPMLTKNAGFEIINKNAKRDVRVVTFENKISTITWEGPVLCMELDNPVLLTLLREALLQLKDKIKTNKELTYYDLDIEVNLDRFAQQLKIKGHKKEKWVKVFKSLKRLQSTVVIVEHKDLKIKESITLLPYQRLEEDLSKLIVRFSPELFKVYNIWDNLTYIDLNFYMDLSTQYQKSIYEILSSNKSGFMSDRYSIGYFSEIQGAEVKDAQQLKNYKRNLTKAFDELISRKFLKSYEWIKTEKKYEIKKEKIELFNEKKQKDRELEVLFN
jgi:hypothetical protein